MAKYTKVSNGALFMSLIKDGKPEGYFYSKLNYNNMCFNLQGKFIRIFGFNLTARNIIFDLDFQTSFSQNCNQKDYEEWFKLTTFKYDALSGREFGEVEIQSSFPKSALNRVFSFVFLVYPANTEVVLSKISFHDRMFAYTAPSLPFNLTNFENLTKNKLGFGQGDSGTMSVYEAANPGAHFKPLSNSVWVTRLTESEICFDFSSTALDIYGQGFLAASANVTVTLSYSSGTHCNGSTLLTESRTISSWSQLQGLLEVGSVSIFSYQSVNPYKVSSIQLTFSPPNLDYNITLLSLRYELI